jgi:hypothetical protein
MVCWDWRAELALSKGQDGERHQDRSDHSSVCGCRYAQAIAKEVMTLTCPHVAHPVLSRPGVTKCCQLPMLPDRFLIAD